jgi:hypothetical protein
VLPYLTIPAPSVKLSAALKSLRKQESSLFRWSWTPAFAGVTPWLVNDPVSFIYTINFRDIAPPEFTYNARIPTSRITFLSAGIEIQETDAYIIVN